MTEQSGKLSFVERGICYESPAYGDWLLDPSRIRVIGEYTNQDGPILDDYFFIFVTDGENEWFEASSYAEGRAEFLAALSSRFKGIATPGLANSTDFKSRVLWPPAQVEKPLFDFLPMQRGGGLLNRVLDRLCPGCVVEGVLRVEFRNDSRSCGRAHEG